MFQIKIAVTFIWRSFNLQNQWFQTSNRAFFFLPQVLMLSCATRLHLATKVAFLTSSQRWEQSLLHSHWTMSNRRDTSCWSSPQTGSGKTMQRWWLLWLIKMMKHLCSPWMSTMDLSQRNLTGHLCLYYRWEEIVTFAINQWPCVPKV